MCQGNDEDGPKYHYMLLMNSIDIVEVQHNINSNLGNLGVTWP